MKMTDIRRPPHLRERLESLLLALEVLGLLRDLCAQRVLVRFELGAHTTLLRDSVNHLTRDSKRDDERERELMLG